MNTVVTLTVILDSELRGKDVLTIQPPATKFFWDHGNNTYLCGKCKTIIAENIYKLGKTDKVFKCNKCGSYNIV